jgi:hypothetical protein
MGTSSDAASGETAASSRAQDVVERISDRERKDAGVIKIS